jgi:asparagine synthase (glutamine-hydrolysing)
MGFSVPLAQWFRGPLRQRVEDSLFGETLADTGIFERRMLEEIVAHHQRGVRDHSSPIWTLLMFEAFLRNVMGGSQRDRAAA